MKTTNAIIYVKTLTDTYRLILHFVKERACGIIRESDQWMVILNATPKEIGEYLAGEGIEVDDWVKALLI
ncbi:MAG: hypothetical protein WCP34_14755 [Pseudomonadota bacterium]